MPTHTVRSLHHCLSARIALPASTGAQKTLAADHRIYTQQPPKRLSAHAKVQYGLMLFQEKDVKMDNLKALHSTDDNQFFNQWL
eukprot:12857797-Prorocentrum_lima.AAC.1